MASSDRLPLVVGAMAAAVVMAAILLAPDLVERSRRPSVELIRAWVAFQVRDEAARPGPMVLEPGESFTLHAVLEGHTGDGSTVFFTEAPALVTAAGPVPQERLRRWDGRFDAKILWFTVEGFTPFLEVDTPAAIERFTFEELFRAEWPRAWSIPGSIDPLNDDHLRRGLPVPDPRFGVQRFHIRVELFDPRQPLVPVRRVRSAGAEEIAAGEGEEARVEVLLPPPLDRLSAVFGLTQIEMSRDLGDEGVAEVTRLESLGLAFSREPVLGGYVGELPAAEEWTQTLLDGSMAWDELVGVGDLVRVGQRVVVLYRDDGDGWLDGEDLCLDFERGAVVAPLDEVFPGVGFVEWVRHHA